MPTPESITAEQVIAKARSAWPVQRGCHKTTADDFRVCKIFAADGKIYWCVQEFDHIDLEWYDRDDDAPTLQELYDKIPGEKQG
jgi:hypothetical protein